MYPLMSYLQKKLIGKFIIQSFKFFFSFYPVRGFFENFGAVRALVVQRATLVLMHGHVFEVRASRGEGFFAF